MWQASTSLPPSLSPCTACQALTHMSSERVTTRGGDAFSQSVSPRPLLRTSAVVILSSQSLYLQIKESAFQVLLPLCPQSCIPLPPHLVVSDRPPSLQDTIIQSSSSGTESIFSMDTSPQGLEPHHRTPTTSQGVQSAKGREEGLHHE